jgi:hypothetical protein
MTMKSTTMTRRSVLGGLLTAGAVAAFPEGIAHASSQGNIDIEALVGTSGAVTPLSAATPGFHYDRFSAISFIPRQTTTYTSVSGGIRHSAPASEIFICPFAPAHSSTLKEFEFYIETGTVAAAVTVLRIGSTGTGDFVVPATVVPVSAVVQTVTLAANHVVDLINFDYEIWVVFHNSGTFRGARVGSIAPTGLITVAQNRKLDTRAGAKPVVGSITTVDLAPDVPNGARAALVTVTATGTANGGFVTAFPGDQVIVPNTSTLNWTTSITDIAATSVVNLGAGTSIKLSIGGAAGTASHLLCDVLGYFI